MTTKDFLRTTGIRSRRLFKYLKDDELGHSLARKFINDNLESKESTLFLQELKYLSSNCVIEPIIRNYLEEEIAKMQYWEDTHKVKHA